MEGDHREGTRGWWRERIERWECSGQSIAAFCRENGIGEKRFYRWRKRLSKEVVQTDSHRLVPVQVKAPSSVGESVIRSAGAFAGVEIVAPSGYRLRLDRGFDSATLANALSVLEGGSC